MNSAQLKEIIYNFETAKNYFIGVFSINTLPQKLSIPSFLICNYDIDTNPGSHWFCLFKTNQKFVECFDSLGVSPDKFMLLQKYCKWRCGSYITFNETQVQSNLTSTCGNFVLYFAFQRLHNLDLSFSDILNEIFDLDIDNNEKRVVRFFEEVIN